MSKKLLFVLILAFHSFSSRSQIYDGDPAYIAYLTFDTAQISDLMTDSSGLWQIGNTVKSYFVMGDTPARSIMTDTLNYYPINSNAWFVISFEQIFNTIITFRHKYQTSSGLDGCIVEFSNDSGYSWQNIIGQCSDSFGWQQGHIYTDNFYSFNDTLTTGEPAFTGVAPDWQTSRIQFFDGFPMKGTSSCDLTNLLLRFRFISDSIPDTLDGWIIDSIIVENDFYCCGVKPVDQIRQLTVHPNPSHDGRMSFPELPYGKGYKIAILNSLGQNVYESEYVGELDLSKQPKGLYFYRVTNDTNIYSGKILLE